MNNKLIILGFGGHARSVLDLAVKCGYKDILFVDENANDDESFQGFLVLREIDFGIFRQADFFSASGNSKIRAKNNLSLCEKGLNIATLISPLAHIGLGAEVAQGSFIGCFSYIGPGAKIGQGSIVNTAAVVEHESVVGAYSHVSINSSIAGRSRLGAHSMLGAGSVVIDGINICDDVMIGAGAVVCSNIFSPGTYVGVPAKQII